jgi:hypothetical protein
MVVFKEDHFSIRDDRSHVCVFAEQLNPCLELKSIAALSCSNSLTSVSPVVMPYTLQSGPQHGQSLESHRSVACG